MIEIKYIKKNENLIPQSNLLFVFRKFNQPASGLNVIGDSFDEDPDNYILSIRCNASYQSANVSAYHVKIAIPNRIINNTEIGWNAYAEAIAANFKILKCFRHDHDHTISKLELPDDIGYVWSLISSRVAEMMYFM